MTPAKMRARLALARAVHLMELTKDMPDTACKKCGREIYCGDLSKICGPDCDKLRERNAKSTNQQ